MRLSWAWPFNAWQLVVIGLGLAGTGILVASVYYDRPGWQEIGGARNGYVLRLNSEESCEVGMDSTMLWARYENSGHSVHLLTSTIIRLNDVNDVLVTGPFVDASIFLPGERMLRVEATAAELIAHGHIPSDPFWMYCSERAKELPPRLTTNFYGHYGLGRRP